MILQNRAARFVVWSWEKNEEIMVEENYKMRDNEKAVNWYRDAAIAKVIYSSFYVHQNFIGGYEGSSDMK